MDDINDVVAVNLRRLREERRLSLDAAAQATGVSKSMLGQIERGVVSPTITTVWKIANGLKVPFTALMARPEKGIEVVERASVKVLQADGGRFRNYPMFPLDDSRGFEMYSIDIDPGARLDSEPHPEGTQEFVVVSTGTLRLTANEQDFTVKAGDAIRFRADVKHAYSNPGKTACRLTMVIHYARKDG